MYLSQLGSLNHAIQSVSIFCAVWLVWVLMFFGVVAFVHTYIALFKSPKIFQDFKNLAAHMLLVFGGSLLAWVVTLLLKYLYRIPRPFVLWGTHPLVAESGYSFPSGHATIATALALFLGASFPRFRFFFSVLAFLVCLGRVLVGVHTPADVLAGMGIGSIIFLCLWRQKIPSA